MSYIEGVDRSQQTLFPAVLDDYVAVDNPIRFIDAFVASLDLHELMFERAEAAETGRPGYDPGDLLRLYLYGYLNKVRSSRRLEREAQRNVEVMWLLRRLTPDFKTIADFRKDNGAAIRRACREFTVLCKKLELFSGELVAIDGSKFRAVNSRSRNFSPERLRKTIEKIDARVNEYLGRLDREDATEGAASSSSAEELRKKIESLRERRDEARVLLGDMEEQQIAEVSLTDPESRRMKTGGVTDVCYNVQVAVDEKHHLIVSEDVTNDATDREWLQPMATASKQILERDELVVAADQGYSSNDQVKECVDRNIIPYIPKPSTSANKKLGLFTKDDFRYDGDNDLYLCPAGEKLTYRFQTIEKGRPIRYYATSACKGCELRTRCTRNKRTRRITRHADEAVMEKMYERVAARPDIYARRKSIVEHVFGTMKRWMDQGFFLMKGLAKVRTEFSLTAFAYNLRRVLNLMSIREMIAALR